MARRRRSGRFGALSMKSCPREGTRLMFAPHPVSLRLYSKNYPLPDPGEVGVVVKMPGFRTTCLGGPGGGLVYVKFPSTGTRGISRYDLEKVKGR